MAEVFPVNGNDREGYTRQDDASGSQRPGNLGRRPVWAAEPPPPGGPRHTSPTRPRSKSLHDRNLKTGEVPVSSPSFPSQTEWQLVINVLTSLNYLGTLDDKAKKLLPRHYDPDRVGKRAKGLKQVIDLVCRQLEQACDALKRQLPEQWAQAVASWRVLEGLDPRDTLSKRHIRKGTELLCRIRIPLSSNCQSLVDSIQDQIVHGGRPWGARTAKPFTGSADPTPKKDRIWCDWDYDTVVGKINEVLRKYGEGPENVEQLRNDLNGLCEQLRDPVKLTRAVRNVLAAKEMSQEEKEALRAGIECAGKVYDQLSQRCKDTLNAIWDGLGFEGGKEVASHVEAKASPCYPALSQDLRDLLDSTVRSLAILGDSPEGAGEFHRMQSKKGVPWKEEKKTQKTLLPAVDEQLGKKNLQELWAIESGLWVACFGTVTDRLSDVSWTIIPHVFKTIDDAIIKQLPTLISEHDRLGPEVEAMCESPTWVSLGSGPSIVADFVQDLLEESGAVLLKCGFGDSDAEKFQMFKHLIVRTMLCEEEVHKEREKEERLKSFLRCAHTNVLSGLLDDESLVPIAKRLDHCDYLARTRDIGDWRRGSLDRFHRLVREALKKRHQHL